MYTFFQPGGLQMSSGPVVNQPLLNPRLNATADSVASAGGSQHPPSGQTSVSQQPPVPNPPTSQPVTAGQLNTATLCKLGQETVQDIVAKAQDIFQTLKNLQVFLLLTSFIVFFCLIYLCVSSFNIIAYRRSMRAN